MSEELIPLTREDAMLDEVSGLPFTVWLQGERDSERQLNVVGLRVEGGAVCVLVSLERDLGEIAR